MKRPMLMQYAPHRVRTWLYYKLYHLRSEAYAELFNDAELVFAPQTLMSLHRGDAISNQIAFTGFYELAMSRLVANLARKEGGLMVDAGANIGYFTLLWASAGAQNRVEAFEASPRVFPVLRSNVKKNAHCASRVVSHNLALGAAPDSMDFDLGPPEQDGWGGLVAQPSGQSVQVLVRRLDEELQDADITFLKVDVEGADTWVLQGASDLLSNRRVKYISWEQNFVRMAALGIDEEESLRLVRGCGYECQPLELANGKVTQWLATRQ